MDIPGQELYVDIEAMHMPDYERFRGKVADVIQDDNMQYVNEHSAQVIPQRTIYSAYIKRLLDIILSACALIITLPVNLVIAVCTFFDVGKPIIFKQKRVGMNGKEFTIIKFRNMTNEKDENGQLLPAAQRVTKFGKFVRKTSLDELLNFWSIFKGDMSIIGPRPLVPIAYKRYSERHKMRCAVRPGLECPFLRTPDHKITWAEQFENDIFYVENVSFALDMKMVFALVRMVFNRKGNRMRGGANRGSFLGYNRDGSSINTNAVPREYVERALQNELVLSE